MQAKTCELLRTRRLRRARAIGEASAFVVALAVVVVSAYTLKRGHGGVPLAETIETTSSPVVMMASSVRAPSPRPVADVADVTGVESMQGAAESPVDHGDAPEKIAVRWFDGRPVRPSKVMWMTVTAYSPDERSCGHWADGRTATNDSVWTNGGRLVAADTRVLPFGSMLTIPGYADGEIVPVLDRGGAIKGSRLDLLYPTHKQARRWGVQHVPVVVWEYAD